jgi:hypothetical protein
MKDYFKYNVTGNCGELMELKKKPTKEELRELANKGYGALSWIQLSEPLEKRLERIEREISRR